MEIPRKSYPMANTANIDSRLRGAGLEPKAASAISAVLRDILHKQTFDERLNYDAIESAVNGVGGGQRSSTVVVAAFNSTQAGKDDADFVCGASNNAEVTINEALNVSASYRGGVRLLEGDYFLSTGEIQMYGGYQSLRGQGPNTRLWGNGGAGASNIIAASAQAVISDLYIDAAGKICIFAYGQGSRVTRCWLDDASYGVQVNAPQIIVSDNYFQLCTNSGVYVDGTCAGTIIANNQFDSCSRAVHIFLSDGITVAINSIDSAYGDAAIEVVGAARETSILGNRVAASAKHGILLRGCHDNLVAGNLLWRYSMSPVNTYDGIHLTDAGEYCAVINNLCRGGQVGIVDGRYGIRIDVGETGHYVTNNDLHRAGATANFSDAGTGTITTAGNRV